MIGDETKIYKMDDLIYSISKKMAIHYYILIRNSGIKKYQTPHLFRAYMSQFNPLSSEYDDKLDGWVVGFELEHQAIECMKKFNGKSILNYTPMDISLITFDK